MLASQQPLAGLPCGLWTCATPSVVPPASPSVCLLQPMIIASAAFYGILPRAFDFVGLTAAATFIYQLQATGKGAGDSNHQPTCRIYRVLLLNTPDVVQGIQCSLTLAQASCVLLVSQHSCASCMLGMCVCCCAVAAAAWGLLVYGLLVFCMEFLPFGAVNPPEVAEYFTLVGVLCELCQPTVPWQASAALQGWSSTRAAYCWSWMVCEVLHSGYPCTLSECVACLALPPLGRGRVP